MESTQVSLFRLQMGCLKCCLSWFVLSGVGLAVLIAYLALPPEPLSIPEDGYWGPEKIAEGWSRNLAGSHGLCFISMHMIFDGRSRPDDFLFVFNGVLSEY